MKSPTQLAVHCKLCQKSTTEVGALQKSHIIPRFILQMSKIDGKSVTYTRDAEKPLAISQEDWKEQMLCEACELLMKHHEDLLNEVLFRHKKKPVMFEGPQFLRVWAKSDRVALALISIFWRAAISTHEAYAYPALPDYMKNDMRGWLSVGRMPNNWHRLIEIKIQRLLYPDDLRFNALIPPFIREKEKSFEFVFVCGGYCWTFVIPPPQDQIFSRSGAIPPGVLSLRIRKVRFTEVPELHELVTDMVNAPIPPEMEAKLQQASRRKS